MEYPTNYHGDEIDLTDLFREIISRWKSILLITLLFTFSGVFYSFWATPKYKSEISVYPTVDESSVPGALGEVQGIAAAFGFNLDSGSGVTFYIPDVVESRSLATDIVLRKWENESFDEPVNLIRFWEIDDNTKWTRKVKRWIKSFFPGRKGDPMRKYLSAARKELAERIKVNEEDSGLIKISVLMEEPQLASHIANYISDYIKRYIAEELELQSRKYRQFIEERLESAEGELRISEEELTDFRKKHTMALEPPETQLQRARLMRNVEVNQEVYITLRQQYELAKIDELKELPIINVLDRAEPAADKDSPRRLLIIVITFLAGGFIGILWVLLRISVTPSGKPA